MAILKFKSNGKWESIAAFQGEPGKDGAIQYTAGEGITIENDTISAEVTKQYVDEAVASGGGSGDLIYDEIILDGEYNVNVSGNSSITVTITDTVAIEKMSNFITNAYLNYSEDSAAKIGLLIRYKQITGNPNLTDLMPMMFNFLNFKYLVQNTYYELYHIRQQSQSTLDRYRLFIRGTWSDNVFTATKIFIDKQRTNIDCLPKTNTTEYAPTSDYHPATKKYVDDAIANAGTGAETGFVLNGSPVFKIGCNYIYQLEVGKTYSGYINADDAIAMYKYCVENGVEYPAINLLMNSSNAQFTGIGVARTKVVDITGSSAMIGIYGLSSSDPNKYWYMDLRISCNADGTYAMSNSTSIKFSEYTGATKTYVDNAIKASITSTLEADY